MNYLNSAKEVIESSSLNIPYLNVSASSLLKDFFPQETSIPIYALALAVIFLNKLSRLSQLNKCNLPFLPSIFIYLFIYWFDNRSIKIKIRIKYQKKKQTINCKSSWNIRKNIN